MAAGDSNLYFSRDTKVYLVQGTGVSQQIWELPILAGYSFSQKTNSSTVELKEMSDATGRSRRGKRVFNDSLSAADWSFDIYARPTLVSSYHRAPEEVLWASLFSESNFNPVLGQTGVPGTITPSYSGNVVTLTFGTAAPVVPYFKVGDSIIVSGITATTNAPNGTFIVTSSTVNSVTYTVTNTPTGSLAGTAIVKSSTFSSTATELDFYTTSANKTNLATFDLYFVLGANKASSANYAADDVTTIYKISKCVANEATINFEIDGITTVAWSGMGAQISEQATFDATANGGPIQIGLASTSNMIRNRLTSLNAVGVTPSAKTYSLTLTGGSITISNNMTFLTPETLGVVNQPLGHITGSRSVSGNFTCYLDELTNGSIDLYQDMLQGTSTVTNKFQLQFFVGGKAASGISPTAPGIMFDMGQCHLEIPSTKIDDVIGLEVAFTALPSSISGTDELTKIRYVGS